MAYYFIILLLVIFPFAETLRFNYANGLRFTPFDIIVALLAIHFVVRYFLKKKKTQYYFIKPVIVFLVFAFLTLLLQVGKLSMIAWVSSALYFVRFVSYSLLLFIVQDFSKQKKEVLVKTLLLSGFITVIFGFVQFFFYQNLGNLFYLGWDNHLYRLFGTFLDPNFTGLFYIFFFFLVLYFLFRERKDKKKLLFFSILAFCTLIALYLTFSRSAYIAFIISLIFLLFLFGKKKYFFLPLLLIGVLIAINNFTLNHYFENMNILRVASTTARIDSVNNAIKIIQDNFIFGVGFNTYRYVQVAYGFRGEKNILESNADNGTDNSFLFVLATTGIIGFFLYINMWFDIIKSLYDKFKSTRSVFIATTLGSIVAMFLSSLFINSLFYPLLIMWLFILIGVTVIEKK